MSDIIINLASELDAKGLKVASYGKALNHVRDTLHDYLDEFLADILAQADCGLDDPDLQRELF